MKIRKKKTHKQQQHNSSGIIVINFPFASLLPLQPVGLGILSCSYST